MADNSSDKIIVAPLSPIESILSLCEDSTAYVFKYLSHGLSVVCL